MYHRPIFIWTRGWATIFLIIAGTQYFTLTHSLAHHDQYRYFIDTLDHPEARDLCELDRQYEWAYKIGRPFTAEIECWIFNHTQVISDITPFRWLTVLLQAVGATILALFLLSLGLSSIAAFAISIAIYLLPGQQNSVLMANLTYPITPAISVGAYWLFHEALDLLPRHAIRAAAIGILAWILQLLAFHLYLGTSTFYFVAAFSAALFHPSRRGLWPVVADFSFFAVAALPFYLALNFLYYPHFLPEMQTIFDYSSTISLFRFTIGTAKTFIVFIPIALNLWNIYPSAVALFIVLLTVTLALLLTPSLRSGLKTLLPHFIGTASVLLLAPSGGIAFRLLLPISSAATILVYHSLTSIVAHRLPAHSRQTGSVVAILLLVIAFGLSLTTSTENAEEILKERALLADALSRLDLRAITHLVVYLPPLTSPQVGFNGRPYITDEFNMPSVAGPDALGANVVQMVSTILRERGDTRLVVDGTNPTRYVGPVLVESSGVNNISAQIGPDTIRGHRYGNLLIFPGGALGVYSPAHREVFWNTGAIWRDGPSTLEGKWFSLLTTSALEVTRERRPSEEPRRAGTAVVDLFAPAIR
jgi:hypothetical protein